MKEQEQMNTKERLVRGGGKAFFQIRLCGDIHPDDSHGGGGEPLSHCLSLYK